jgi:branched-subunit amino acid transport protein
MKLLLFLILNITLFSNNVFAQNVGIGTTTPTNTLHVVVDPGNSNQNPVRFQGIQQYTNEDSVLVVNTSTGVINYMPISDVLSNIPPNILDSLILNSVLNNTDTIYNNQSVINSILSIMLSNSDSVFNTQTFKDSVLGVILSNIDTIFTLTRDSLLTDSTFMNTLRDSINTDNQNIDSLTITGTVFTTYIEDGTSASIDVSNMLDSVIFSKSDSLYTFISDSLTKDSLWINSMDSMLSIYGDTIYFNDSSYTLVRDSLLNDSLFLDSLVSLIGDSINTDDQNIDC